MINNIMVAKINIGIPIKSISFGTSSSLTNLVIPNPAAILNILEPMILPRAISTLRLNKLATAAAISGKDVPNAMMVRPITVFEIERLIASSIALLIIISAPKIKPTMPPKQ